MLYREISFDMIVCSGTSTEISMLGISHSKPYRIFKSLLILLMIVNNGGNEPFLLCKAIASKGSIAEQSKSWDIILQGSTKPSFDDTGCKKNVLSRFGYL